MSQKKPKFVAVWGGTVLYSDKKSPVKSRHGLVLGSKYIVPTMFGSRLMKVVDVDYDKGHAKAEDDHTFAHLEHKRDIRGYVWTSAVSGDKKARAGLGLVV